MKQKTGRKLLSFLLTLAMVVGLMPGMGLTAYAADPYASLKNTTTVITFDSKEWYLIDYDSTTVTLLSKECVGVSTFGANNTYSGSTVETYVNNWSANNISTDAKSAVSGDVFLLTTDQAQAITNKDVLKCSQASGANLNFWWLCSPGSGKYAACVGGDYGNVDDEGDVVKDTFGVRLALKLDLSKVTFDADTKTFALAATSPAHTHNDITFTEWTSNNSLPTEAGNYYLANDVTIGSTWNVPTGTTNLCLNGHGIIMTGTQRVITVPSGCTLNLCDCGTKTEHKFTVNNPSAKGAGLATVNDSLESGYQTFTGGYITGGNDGQGGGVYVDAGTFHMAGGTIIGNKATAGGYCDGGGVSLSDNASSRFVMTGGAIQHNTSTGRGPALGIAKNATVELTGDARITHNSRDNNGWCGGISSYGTLTISGNVQITNNRGQTALHPEAGSVNISGAPVIFDNEVSAGDIHLDITLNIVGELTEGAKLGVYWDNPKVFTNSTDTSFNDVSKFVSDNPNLSVVKDADGQLSLRAEYAVTLDRSSATVAAGSAQALTAAVTPQNATDKKVVWSVSGDAVKLYSDENCENEITLNTAVETLTVYAKGISAGSATVTCTSNADSSKSASCDVTANEAATEYPLWVGGTQVTSANAGNIDGNNKASYNAERNTLTLNGYSNGEEFYKEAEAGVYNTDYRIAAGVYYAGAEKLTVALEGNNVLTMPEFSENKLDNAAFFSKGNVEFTGTGLLTATGGKASDSSDDSNVGSYGLCAIGENAAFTGSGAVTFTAGSGESSYGAYFGKETAVAFSGGTVTMTGSTSTGGSYGMYCGRVEVTGGKVQVTGGEAGTNSLGIFCWKDISVSDGAVTAAGGSAADSSYGFFGESISVTGGEATFTGGTGVNYSEGAYCKKDVSVTRGSLTAVGGSAKYSYGLYSYDGYENKNGVITYGVAVSNGKLTTAGGSATEKSCGLCLLSSAISVTGGEVEVTGGEAGKTSYGMDGNYSVYARGGKLTAQGGTVTGDNGESCGIYIGAAPFYIEGSATVNATGGQANVSGGESFGIRCFGSYIRGGVITATGGNAAYSCGCYDRMALLVDAGTFTATGGEGNRSHGIFNRDYIEVNGGTVTAVGGSGSAESCGVYLAARQSSGGTYKASTLTVTGGEVSATGGSCGVFCDPATDGKVIVITGGKATAQGNVAISKPPILGADVSASASTELDGTPAEYNEEENNNYKLFTTVTAPGSKTPITSVSFTVEEPVVGAEPAEWVEITTEPEGALTTTAYRAVWVEVDKDYNYVPMTSPLFEAGKRYAVLEPNEANAGAPLVALCASGYVLPTDGEPVYTINGEKTMLFGFFGPYTPIEGAEFSVSVSPAELRFSAYTGYSEEDPSLHREITASNTGNGKVRFITAGFTESSMNEQFGLIVGGMTATVYPKEGLAEGTYRATVKIEDWYDRFKTIEVPVTFTVYTRSTAPGTPAAETVTIPVSGDDETVNVKVEVKDDTATVKEADVDKVLSAEEVGTVTVDVSTLKEDVTGVVIPSALLEKVADAVADEENTADGLEVKLPAGSVAFDADALATITEQADGKDLTLRLDDVKVTELTSAQQEGVSDLEIEVVLDAYLTSGGKRISDFNGGSATVKIPYTLKDGQTAQGLVVWYVAADGTRTQVPASYDGKNVVFTVPHFSNYVIAYDAEKAAACPKDATCPISAFDDADPTAWYHDGVHFALENSMMNGVGDGKFDPNGTTTRGMIVTILYRLEDSPAVTAANPFDDVAAGQWYTDAVIWAAENKIVSGYGDGKFGPDDAITREQLAAILYRYAQTKGEGFKGLWSFKLDFPDAADVSEWATEAVSWMVMNGIINGKDGKLVPGGNATRAETATMLQRFCAKLAE